MTTCPFCNSDPFEYIDNGIGLEAVAVTCCEWGSMLYEDDVPLEEVRQRKEKADKRQKRREAYWAKHPIAMPEIPF